MGIFEWSLMGAAFWAMVVMVGAACFGTDTRTGDVVDDVMMLGCGLLVVGLPLVELIVWLSYFASLVLLKQS